MKHGLIPVTDNRVPNDIRQYCVENEITFAQYTQEGSNFQVYWPRGAFGDTMDNNEIRRKHAWKFGKCQALVNEIGFQVGGAITPEEHKEMDDIINRLGKLNQSFTGFRAFAPQEDGN
jgi:hypothetical protein